jgi:hypothetical protein
MVVKLPLIAEFAHAGVSPLKVYFLQDRSLAGPRQRQFIFARAARRAPEL